MDKKPKMIKSSKLFEGFIVQNMVRHCLIKIPQ